LLALLVARAGLPVVVHGVATEASRVFTSEVFAALDIAPRVEALPAEPGEVAFVPTAVLCPGLQRLLDVRRVVNLRNPAHSLVKLMSPCDGKSLLVTSYTHPEYALSMAATLTLMRSNAVLLRGTEGEAVADPRRTPRMQGFIGGIPQQMVDHQAGSLAELPDLPHTTEALRTADYIRAVMAGAAPIPRPIAQQVDYILQMMKSC
jgi:anthranilate phosphoribosyltransferase